MERRIFLYIAIGLVVVVAVIGILFSYPKVTNSPPAAEVETAVEVDAQTSATLWMNPMAIVVPGENPLWFELSDDGPVVISSPEEASLRTFFPWPHSMHVTDMLIQDDRLIFAVNRLGFLAIIPWDDSRLGLYPVFDKAYWSRYSIASLFCFDETPSVLLYRNDFFSSEGFPLPETPVMGLVKGNTSPIRARIPAFADFSASKGWDIEALNRGKNGIWHFIAAQKSSDLHEKLYYTCESLDSSPVSISMGDYWLAMEPESLSNAPFLQQNTAKAAINRRQENSSFLIEAITPNSEYKFHYSYNSGGESDMVSLLLYANDDKAFAVFPDGNGAFGKKNADNSIEIESYTLPQLPQNYFYTGIALADNTIIASWEEQQSYGVGAAGMVLLNVGAD